MRSLLWKCAAAPRFLLTASAPFAGIKGTAVGWCRWRCRCSGTVPLHPERCSWWNLPLLLPAAAAAVEERLREEHLGRPRWAPTTKKTAAAADAETVAERPGCCLTNADQATNVLRRSAAGDRDELHHWYPWSPKLMWGSRSQCLGGSETRMRQR